MVKVQECLAYLFGCPHNFKYHLYWLSAFPVTSRTYQGCLSLCFFAPWWHLVWLLRLRRWFRRSLSWWRRWYDVRRRWGWCWHCPRIFIFIVILRCIFFLSEEPLQEMKIVIIFWLLYSTFLYHNIDLITKWLFEQEEVSAMCRDTIFDTQI